MAAMKVQDVPHRKSRSKPPHTTNNCTAQPHFDTDTSYEESQTDRSALSSASASARSSVNDTPYTIESFEAIRTVGTGKNILTKKEKSFLNLPFYSRHIWPCSSCISS
jgi:hypothetical protein